MGPSLPYPDFKTCPRCRIQTWEVAEDHSYCWDCDYFRNAEGDNRDELDEKNESHKWFNEKLDETA